MQKAKKSKRRSEGKERIGDIIESKTQQKKHKGTILKKRKTQDKHTKNNNNILQLQRICIRKKARNVT